MPRHGARAPFDASIDSMPGAVYSPFADRIEGHPGPLVPLHVGDTWMEPFEGARMESLRTDENPGMHRYGPTGGLPPLLDAIVQKVRERNALECERENVLVGAGRDVPARQRRRFDRVAR